MSPSIHHCLWHSYYGAEGIGFTGQGHTTASGTHRCLPLLVMVKERLCVDWFAVEPIANIESDYIILTIYTRIKSWKFRFVSKTVLSWNLLEYRRRCPSTITLQTGIIVSKTQSFLHRPRSSATTFIYCTALRKAKQTGNETKIQNRKNNSIYTRTSQLNPSVGRFRSN